MQNELSQNPAFLWQAQQNWKKKNTILVAEGLERVISPTIARVKH